MRRFLRDPLVLFLVLGTAIFVADRLMRGGGHRSHTIEVADSFAAGLCEDHRRRTGHTPTASEAEALVEDFVKDEVLVREALRYGFDRGDTVIRRRLAQKMEFYVRSGLDVPPPTDDDIARYVRAHPDQYTEDARYGFTHLFFSRDARSSNARRDADAALVMVRSGATPASDAFALGPVQPTASRADLSARYGPSFASQLATCAVGVPCGPLESTYGYHIVTLTRVERGALTPVAHARRRAAPDIVREREDAAYRVAIRELIADYEVERVHDTGGNR